MNYPVYDYSYFDNKQKQIHNRRTIDGSITGCGKCVGYCQFSEHSGFLTKEQRKEHNCIGKGCHYYLSKPKTEKVKSSRKNTTNEIIQKSSKVISDLEGIKIIRAEEITQGGWKLKYVTLTNEYSIADLERLISSVLGQKAVMQRLNYDFEIAAQLIYS